MSAMDEVEVDCDGEAAAFLVFVALCFIGSVLTWVLIG